MKKQLKILLLEDHVDFADGVVAGLRLSTVPYEIRHATTLSEATQLLEHGQFDAAVVDLGLPDASGLDAALTIRRLAPALPIVVMSGENFDANASELIEHGVQDYVQKGAVSLRRLDHTIRLACKRKRQEDSLRSLAALDELTGLLNRREFFVQLDRALSEANRRATFAALLAIDLDGFKKINDTHGHLTGDEILRNVATRLKESIRAEDSVGRLGGDEFAIVVSNLSEESGARRVAHTIASRVHEAIDIDGMSHFITCSIGIALYPVHGDDGIRLWECADEAMYRIKNGNKAGFAVYHPYPQPKAEGD